MDYEPHRAALGKEFYASSLLLASIGNDISTDSMHGNKPRASPPTPHQLMTKGFGILSLAHSFHQEPTFKTTNLVPLKAAFVTPSNILVLHNTHPVLSHLLCACVDLRTSNFLWLSEYNSAWSHQTELSGT